MVFRTAKLPVWGAMELVSVATGLEWHPRWAATSYALGQAAGQPAEIAYASLTPAERIGALSVKATPEPGHALVDLLLGELAPGVRDRVLGGETVPLSEALGSTTAAGLHTCAFHVGLGLVAADGMVAPVADGAWDASILRGYFTVYGDLVRAEVLFRDSPARWWVLLNDTTGGPSWPGGRVAAPAGMGQTVGRLDWVEGANLEYGTRTAPLPPGIEGTEAELVGGA